MSNEGASNARALEDRAMMQHIAGAARAFDELYRRLAPVIRACLVSYTRDDAAAEDLLQQTFLQVHLSRGRFAAGAPIRPWALAIARRLAIDALRRKQSEERCLHQCAPPRPVCQADEVLEAFQLGRALAVRFGALPQTQRVAFELMRGEGLSAAEAALRLGLTPNAVKVRAHRAHHSLRCALERRHAVERPAA
jgi:RNA polymerase sigma-70 factor, ECF subfamily